MILSVAGEGFEKPPASVRATLATAAVVVAAEGVTATPRLLHLQISAQDHFGPGADGDVARPSLVCESP